MFSCYLIRITPGCRRNVNGSWQRKVRSAYFFHNSYYNYKRYLCLYNFFLAHWILVCPSWSLQWPEFFITRTFLLQTSTLMHFPGKFNCESSCEVYNACASAFTPRDDHFSLRVGKYRSKNVNLCDFQDLMTTVLWITTTSSTASQVGAMQLIGKHRGCATHIASAR